MGIDVNWFVHAPDEHLVCSVCTDVLDSPVVTSCDHHFCRACLQRVLSTTRVCPDCRRPITDVGPTSRLVRNMIGQLRVWCPNKARGCGEPVALECLPAHRQACAFAPGPSVEVPRAWAGEGESEPCPHQGCSARCAARDLRAHLASCPHRLEPCGMRCGQDVPVTHHARHRLEECGMVEVGCDVDGCAFRARRGNSVAWREHRESGAGLAHHLALTLGSVGALKAQVGRLQDTVRRQAGELDALRVVADAARRSDCVARGDADSSRQVRAASSGIPQAKVEPADRRGTGHGDASRARGPQHRAATPPSQHARSPREVCTQRFVFKAVWKDALATARQHVFSDVLQLQHPQRRDQQLAFRVVLCVGDAGLGVFLQAAGPCTLHSASVVSVTVVNYATGRHRVASVPVGQQGSSWEQGGSLLGWQEFLSAQEAQSGEWANNGCVVVRVSLLQ